MSVVRLPQPERDPPEDWAVIADLYFTFDDLLAPVDYYVPDFAPSLAKQALSLGLLDGELRPHGEHYLKGTLELSAAGRRAVRRFRLTWPYTLARSA
jgi:hypothetical protein